MRNRFNQQLKTLNIELIKMFSLVQEAVGLAFDLALNDSSTSSAKNTIDTKINEAKLKEEEIDQMESKIEDLCLKLLIQQQPVADDFRLVTLGMKMIRDLERIGDQALDISLLSIYISNNSLTKKMHLNQMAKSVYTMLKQCKEALVSRNLELAKQTASLDDIIDEYFVEVQNEIAEIIENDKSNTMISLDLLLVAKYLERIADHVENNAQQLVSFLQR